jgi:hypothetical protein
MEPNKLETSHIAAAQNTNRSSRDNNMQLTWNCAIPSLSLATPPTVLPVRSVLLKEPLAPLSR